MMRRRKRLLVPIAIFLSSDCIGRIVIPIEIENGNPIASARINGVPVKLVIDSGGGMVALKPESARRLGATRTGSNRSATDAHGNESTQELLTLKNLELGGSNFSNVEAAEYAGEIPRDGSVGRALLNQFVTVYDYSSRKITLFTPGERGADRECRGAEVRTIAHPEGVIVSMAEIDSRAMKVVWDTGATHSFLNKTFADTHQLPLDPPFYASSHFSIGEEDFGPLRFVVLDIHEPDNVDGFVGYNFFASHVVCIDAVKQLVRIRRN